MEFCNKSSINNFINDYTEEIQNDNAAIFAGAGLSVGAGAVSWKELLRNSAEKINLDVDKEHDLVAVAQHIYNQSNSRNKITTLIKNHINSEGEVTNNHRILSRLPIDTYWTTNYDEYIEESFKEVNKIADTKRNVRDLSISLNNADVRIYKMHGDINQADEAVLIKDDFEIYDKKNELFTLALKNDLMAKTFLFIGFSFDDPNLENILSKIRIMLEGNHRTHYCFFKKVKESDFKFEDETNIKDNHKIVEYAKNKQYLKMKDLERYGINSILVDEYNDITKILKRIENNYKSKKIFISGSNSDSNFSDFKIRGNADTFISKLSSQLHQNGYHITTGLGLYVSNYVIDGVVTNLNEKNSRDYYNSINIAPFPQKISDKVKRKEVWKKHRKNLLSQCGIAIFIMGNKYNEKSKDDDNLINADGVLKEFKIARKKGLKLIPIGSTGSQSKKLWADMNLCLKAYYPEADDEFVHLFGKLGESGVHEDEMIEVVLKLLQLIKKND